MKIKGKLMGIKINGEFIPVGENASIEITQQPLEVGDSVNFEAGDNIYSGGNITSIDDKGHWVNGILIPFGSNIWKV